MQITLLKPNQTQTPDDSIICETFSGTYTLLCVKYVDSPVRLQVKEVGGAEWQDATFAGVAKVLEKQGATLELPIAPCFEYRVVTDTAGAEVVAIPEIDF